MYQVQVSNNGIDFTNYAPPTREYLLAKADYREAIARGKMQFVRLITTIEQFEQPYKHRGEYI